MAMRRGEPVVFGVQAPGAVAPVTGTIDGVALETGPSARAGTLDSYDVTLSAAETDVEHAYILLTDSTGQEFGFTLVFDGSALVDYDYRVLLDSDGDGTPDIPEVGIGGVVVVASGPVTSVAVTGEDGVARFRIPAGEYAFWPQHPRYTRSGPDVEVVS